MGETEFQQALSTAPGLYFDWQGEIPVAVLNGWLSVDNQTLTGTVLADGCYGGGWDRCSCTIG